MVLWYFSSLVLWYYGTKVLWYYGRGPGQSWHACRIRWSAELGARRMSVDASVIEPPLFFGLPSAAPAMSGDVQLFDLS